MADRALLAGYPRIVTRYQTQISNENLTPTLNAEVIASDSQRLFPNFPNSPRIGSKWKYICKCLQNCDHIFQAEGVKWFLPCMSKMGKQLAIIQKKCLQNLSGRCMPISPVTIVTGEISMHHPERFWRHFLYYIKTFSVVVCKSLLQFIFNVMQ